MVPAQSNHIVHTGRAAVACCAIALLTVGLASCAAPNDAQSNTALGSNAPETADADTGTPSEAPREPEEHPSESLDSADVFAMGMAGDAAIKCDYADEDLTGTIYLNGPDMQRFDAVNANGVPTHIVMHEGQAHAWNDAQTEGARYPKPDGQWLVADDIETVKAHSSNCVRFDDLSVFELPRDVTFTDLPTG